MRSRSAPPPATAENAQRPANLARHAADMAALLASEWAVAGAHVRCWHARFLDTPDRPYATFYDVTLVQRRGVEGFSVGRVADGMTESLASGAAVSLASAVIWLGLDQIGYALSWVHEL